jgi:GNAT superfamily N-acetyltransferase
MHPHGRSPEAPRPEIGDAGTVTGTDPAGARPTRGLRIAAATRAEVPTILDMIRGLAQFERLAHLCIATEEDLHRELFSASPAAEVILAWEDGEAAGFALFFHNFSTFLGRRGLYLEDLFVLPAFRRRGYGRALLIYLARLAVERGCGRFEWSVLDWNAEATAFYQALGAQVLPEWRLTRVTGAALESLAAQPLLPTQD